MPLFRSRVSKEATARAAAEEAKKAELYKRVFEKLPDIMGSVGERVGALVARGIVVPNPGMTDDTRDAYHGRKDQSGRTVWMPTASGPFVIIHGLYVPKNNQDHPTINFEHTLAGWRDWEPNRYVGSIRVTEQDDILTVQGSETSSISSSFIVDSEGLSPNASISSLSMCLRGLHTVDGLTKALAA